MCMHQMDETLTLILHQKKETEGNETLIEFWFVKDEVSFVFFASCRFHLWEREREPIGALNWSYLCHEGPVNRRDSSDTTKRRRIRKIIEMALTALSKALELIALLKGVLLTPLSGCVSKICLVWSKTWPQHGWDGPSSKLQMGRSEWVHHGETRKWCFTCINDLLYELFIKKKMIFYMS